MQRYYRLKVSLAFLLYVLYNYITYPKRCTQAEEDRTQRGAWKFLIARGPRSAASRRAL